MMTHNLLCALITRLPYAPGNLRSVQVDNNVLVIFSIIMRAVLQSLMSRRRVKSFSRSRLTPPHPPPSVSAFACEYMIYWHLAISGLPPLSSVHRNDEDVGVPTECKNISINCRRTPDGIRNWERLVGSNQWFMLCLRLYTSGPSPASRTNSFRYAPSGRPSYFLSAS